MSRIDRPSVALTRSTLPLLRAGGCTLLLAALASAALAQPAGNAKPAARKPAATAPCRPGEASFFRDEGLTIKAANKLKFTKSLLRENVHVKVSGGVATISGQVSAPQHIATVVDTVSQIEGITCVHNYLKVGAPEPASTGPQ